jgi:type VI protein secretion system component VasK
MEYFDDLDRENRAQVWGMTFDLDRSKLLRKGIHLTAPIRTTLSL